MLLRWSRRLTRRGVLLVLLLLLAGLSAAPGTAHAGGGGTSRAANAAGTYAAMYAAVRARAAADRAPDRGAGLATDAAAQRAAAFDRLFIPPFARKYGMKCSACHNAVPELNEYGRAFRDNGYRMRNGTDDLRANNPAYWPIFAWAFKSYQLNTDRAGGETVQQRGGFSNGSAAFGIMGAIGDHVSVRFVPEIYENGQVIVDHGWIRYNRAFNTDWVNVRAGAMDFDLPWSAGRDLNVGDARFQTLWFYGVPGSVSRFSLFSGEPGVEVMGHDRGSFNRYVVHVFNTPGAPSAHTAMSAPGIFSHLTHRFSLPSGFVRDVDVGAFGAYATWPVGVDSSDHRASRRIGTDIDAWLASDALPLHVTLVGMRGSDDRDLIPGAVRSGTYNAGLLQADYVPAIPVVFFGRLQAIRNQDQAIAGRPADFGDQNFFQGGIRHALELNSRFATILELSYSRQQIKRGMPDGSTATHDILWTGIHLIF